MRKIKLLIAAAVALVLMFSFAGCGTDADKIVGKWKGSMDMSQQLVDALSTNSEDVKLSDYIDIKDFKIDFTLEFKDSGSYKIKYDSDSIKTSLENVKPEISTGMKKYLAKIMDDNGDEETVDEAMEQMGMDYDTYFDMVFNTDTISSTLGDNLEDEKGIYQIDEGKLYMTSEDKINKKKYKTYEFESDDKLKLKKAVGEEDDTAALAKKVFPLTLERED